MKEYKVESPDMEKLNSFTGAKVGYLQGEELENEAGTSSLRT